MNAREALAEIKGQPVLYRAMEVAMAGGHSLLVLDPAGCLPVPVGQIAPRFCNARTVEETEPRGFEIIVCVTPHRYPEDIPATGHSLDALQERIQQAGDPAYLADVKPADAAEIQAMGEWFALHVITPEDRCVIDRVSRTIAWLGQSAQVSRLHLTEACIYAAPRSPKWRAHFLSAARTPAAA